MINYMIQVTTERSEIKLYFKHLGGHEGAATFFYRFCKSKGITAHRIDHTTPYQRAERDGLTIDFERPKDETHSIIFELQ